MLRPASKSNSARHFVRGLAWTALAGALLAPQPAQAQACCSGASAITPGRLELHERALVGVQLRGSFLVGSYGAAGSFRERPTGAAELDFEQDVLGAFRFLKRAQAGVFLPVLESWRKATTTGPELGGGIGDLNLNARYDFVWAREARYLPGIGALLGVSVPTGRAPEAARLPLGSDATGTGTTQLSAGLALERPLGDFLVNVTGILAKRVNRHVQGVESELGTQLTVVVGVGYAVAAELSVAAVVTYLYEGNARVDGHEVRRSARRGLRLAAAFCASITDTLRLQGSIFADPPLSGIGQNQSVSVGATSGLVRSFL
jgi:hypothetical protein